MNRYYSFPEMPKGFEVKDYTSEKAFWTDACMDPDNHVIVNLAALRKIVTTPFYTNRVDICDRHNWDSGFLGQHHPFFLFTDAYLRPLDNQWLSKYSLPKYVVVPKDQRTPFPI